MKIIELDQLFIPIHVGPNHWCLARIDFRTHLFEYYDSYHGMDMDCLNNLRRYVKDEARTWSDLSDYNLQDWFNVGAQGDAYPLQTNTYDCGVFMCQFAQYLSQDYRLDFTQDDMPKIRRKMVWEISNNKFH